MNRICVLGGGASGMAAAITIARNNPDLSLVILEKNKQLGKKLLATGNGRCNISNSSILGEKFIIDFLNSIGVFTREEEDGRVYPFSGRAKDVVDLFNDSLLALGVKVVTNFTVKKVEKTDSGFLILGNAGEEIKSIKCSKVVLALGGKAAPQFGTIGEGYVIAKSLGLDVTKIFPGLTWVGTSKAFVDISGIRVKARANLLRRGEILAEEKGEVQFTKHGLSGICIFNLSSQVILEKDYSFSDYEINLDLMAEYSLNQVQDLMKERRTLRGLRTDRFLHSILPSPLEKEVLLRSGLSLLDLEKPANTLKDATLNLISYNLKNLTYPIKNIGGWKDAQVTMGGVSLEQISQKTWEVYSLPGLYVIGEMLDQQGPCGGYNLHNAWKTGIEAGKALGK